MATRTAERIDEASSVGPRVRVDDFVRLGIGVREARVGVIRRAAIDATAAVALDEPSGQRDDFDDRIARIAASTYRLLDPRGRNELMQRIQLLQLESPPAQVKPWWKPRHTTVVTQGQLRDRFDPSAADDTYLPMGLRAESPWKALARRLGLFPLSRRGVGAGSAIASISTLIVLPIVLAMRSDAPPPSGELTTPATTVSAGGEPVSRPLRNGNAASQLTTDFASPTVDEPVAAPVSPFAEAFAPSPIPSDAASDPASPAPSTPTVLPGTAPISADPRAFVPNVEPTAGLDTPSIDDVESMATDASTALVPEADPMPLIDPFPASPMAPTPVISDDDATVDEPTMPIAPTPNRNSEETPPIAASQPNLSDTDGMPTVDAAMDSLTQVAAPAVADPDRAINDGRFPHPSPEAIAVATERLARLRADLPAANTDVDLITNIRKLLQTATESEPGSADRWVLLLESSQHLLMMGRTAEAEQTLFELSTEYQASELQLRQRLLDPVLSSARTITQKERVIGWALSTSEQLLRGEDFDSAATTLRGATTLAVKLGGNDLRTRLISQTDAIKQAKRIAPLATKTLAESTAATASSSAANSVGRYLCLYLGDWERGLPWLAKASTAKLAKTAQLEIDTATVPDSKLVLVDQWIECSADLRGRSGEAILLHARDLVAEAMVESSGLKAKDLERKLAEIDAMLPADLRTVAPTPSIAAAPIAAMPAGNLTGMLGRLKADGLDVSALIRYDAGLSLTHDAFSQILDQLGIQAGAISLEFVGLIDLPENSTIRFVTSTGTDKADAVVISVNNQPVALSVDGLQNRRAGTLDLPAGSHMVRWQFGGKQLATCHLVVEDDRAKKPLTLRHTPALLEQVLSVAPARLRVNVIRAN
ncbi:hypothetical protein [Rosistilla carotiformis]|nr:hypothetical protein [Rosistilla carotiformis]